jgi:hypothetical protein
MNPTHDRAAAMLGDVSAGESRCDAADKAISDGATTRLADVEKRLEELRPEVLKSADAADEYQGLIIERHRLNQVVMPPSGLSP